MSSSRNNSVPKLILATPRLQWLSGIVAQACVMALFGDRYFRYAEHLLW